MHLYLFGSTARDEARPESDVDLFFDHEYGALSLFDIMHIKELAAEILGAKTDMIPRRGLHRLIKDRVEAGAIQVF
jgi:predicted nucleotidyltransferase